MRALAHDFGGAECTLYDGGADDDDRFGVAGPALSDLTDIMGIVSVYECHGSLCTRNW